MARTYETETVVLLESSPFWLEAVSGIVEEIGFSRVLSADSATQALALIEQSRPSLFLYGLAESGDPAWGAYLAMVNARFPELKIIVLSTVEDEEAIALVLRSGAAGYVVRRAGLREDRRQGRRRGGQARSRERASAGSLES